MNEDSVRSVFFYGLFMDFSLLHVKGLTPLNLLKAYVDGYGLRIGERATLVKAEGERAYGVITTLPEEDLVSLYGERSVADYVPHVIEATDLKGLRRQAVVYNLPISMLSGRNKAYARSLAKVAEKIGLPPEYIAEIETWAA